MARSDTLGGTEGGEAELRPATSEGSAPPAGGGGEVIPAPAVAKPSAAAVSPGSPLSERLVAMELVAPQAVAEALKVQGRTGEGLARILVRRGHITPEALTLCLAQGAGFPVIRALSGVTEALDLLAVARIPREVAFRLGVFPLALHPTHLTIAMADPLNALALQTLEAMAGVPLEVLAAPAGEIRRALCEVFREVGAPQASLQGAVGWGMGEEERAELLGDPGGGRLLRWLVQRGRRVGARSLLFLPRGPGRSQGDGGEIRLEGAHKPPWGAGPFTLSPEWFAQLVGALEGGGFSDLGRFRGLATEIGVTGRLSLRVPSEGRPVMPAEGVTALRDGARPGLLLLCDPLLGRRAAVASALASELAADPGEIVAVGGVEAPVGSLRIPLPPAGQPLLARGAFRPQVLLVDSCDVEVVARTLTQGHPEGWLILPSPVATLVQALVHMRVGGPSLGSLAATLAAGVEVGEDGAIGWLLPDEAFMEALLSWDVVRLERWRRAGLAHAGRGRGPSLERVG